MVKVGLIGAGFMGKMHSQVYQVVPEASLVAVSDLDEEKAKEILPKGKIYTHIEDLLKDPQVDMVDICLPTFLHKDAVIKSAKAGKHILCEKPIALRVEDAEEMIKETEKAKVKFMVAHCLRLWPEYIVLKEIVEKGGMGRVVHATFTRLSPLPVWSWGSWLLNASKSGGALLDLHIHDVDFSLYLLGKPEYIYSRGVKNNSGWVHVFSTFSYPEGTIVFIEGGWDYPASFPFTHSYLVKMEKGTLLFNPNYANPLMLCKDKEVEYPEVKKVEAKAEAGGNVEDLGGYYNEIEYFIRCIEENSFPEIITPEDARDSLALVTKEMESLEKGKPVKI